MIDHDCPAGPLNRCQICGSSNLRQIIDLGAQPPCDSLLTKEQLKEPEATYPLRLNQCPECSLAQLDYVVPAEKVYPAEYPYKAGISWPVVQAHKAMAQRLVSRFGAGHVVDIGCNDGTLLQQFQGLGCPVTGVEPTDIAKVAQSYGVATHQAFFTERLAKGLTPAHLITLTNVFAHMGDLGEVMRGIDRLLSKDGVLVIENHYLLDVLERNQFDTIYHEHIRTYSLKSLVALFAQYAMEVFDVDRVPRYGGNIRVYVARKGKRLIESSVGNLLETEDVQGLSDPRRWAQFRVDVAQARYQFMEFARRHAGDIAACSAPGRASTLLNYFGVTPELLPYTGELDTSLKLGKYLPGCRIPVVSNRRIREEQPKYLVLLAWHYGAEVASRIRGEGVTSKFIVPLPHFQELQ